MASDSRVTIVGIGYVGMPLAIMLAKSGYEVSGCDVREDIVDGVNAGILTHLERDLNEAFAESLVRQNFTGASEPRPADIFVISVPTPLDRQKRAADLSHVRAAVESIVPVLQPGNLIILESTVPPYTCRNVIEPQLAKAGWISGRDVHLVHCPERILPGNALHEIIYNDRVIGSRHPDAAARARDMYGRFVQGDLLLTDDVTAELVKLMENTYRDVNIALSNELAAVAEGLGVDARTALDLANRHPRVNLLSPGIGTGGHCIPIDPWFLVESDPVNTRLIKTARDVNMAVPSTVAAKIRSAVGNVANPRILAVGLTYKPNTYDLRESPAVHIVELLRGDGYRVDTYDPYVPGHEQGTLLERAARVDCLAVLVEHDLVMQQLEAHREAILARMRHPIVLRFHARTDVHAAHTR